MGGWVIGGTQCRSGISEKIKNALPLSGCQPTERQAHSLSATPTTSWKLHGVKCITYVYFVQYENVLGVRRQIARANKFRAVAPKILESSVRNLLYVTLLAPRILKWLHNIRRIYAPLLCGFLGSSQRCGWGMYVFLRDMPPRQWVIGSWRFHSTFSWNVWNEFPSDAASYPRTRDKLGLSVPTKNEIR
jgi:hypothetical protein